ncbi:unnamed protein product [Acanthoscelides obtectus]|uniref:DDE Tnp4 domain-containing protein n=1 Tax=Acanthoscelides obtectus TaxID=200917 RepID=A0A9P0PLH0_ACAOB|nr:unnamed protein product [Acanthoscelides obtectus]CAK1655678.1 hypothetical protein AOBTE_LOCUS19255 [Acanthoscelides obtectus]
MTTSPFNTCESYAESLVPINKKTTMKNGGADCQSRKRYLASGNTFTDLHYSFRIGIKTISRIVREVCSNIWLLLHKEYMAIPDVSTWQNIAYAFEKTANFPNCIGAVDSKHIRLIKPEDSGSMYFNYKGYCSIVLMVS